MVDNSEVEPRIAFDSNEADAATNAFLRFTESAKEFFSYQRIYAAGAQANKALSVKEAEAKEKDRKIRELESAIAVWNRHGNEEVTRIESQKAEIVKEKSDLDTRLRQEQTQVEKLEKLLDGATRELAKLRKEVQALKGREDQLKTALNKETSTREGINRQLRVARNELGEYAAYTKDQVDLNLTDFSKTVTKVWKRTNDLVEKYFSLDISTESSKDHDTWTQNVCSVIRPPSGSILIPPTNTPAAKAARKAVMLNVFALVFAQWIFTATTSSLAQAGLDDILLELTKQDERKEMLCRAMLISVPSGSPTEHRELPQLAKSVTETSGILFSSKVRSEMKSEVKNLIAEASECWNASRWSRWKLIATLDYEVYPDSWTKYPASSRRYQRGAQNMEASDPEDGEEIASIAFPAILARKRSEWETIFPGILIHFSHLQGAEEEWREENRKRRFSRSGIPNNVLGLTHSRNGSNTIG